MSLARHLLLGMNNKLHTAHTFAREIQSLRNSCQSSFHNLNSVWHKLAILDPLPYILPEWYTQLPEQMRTAIDIVYSDLVVSVLLDRVSGQLYNSKMRARDERGSGQNFVCEFLGRSNGNCIECEGNRGSENGLDGLCIGVTIKDVGGTKGLEELGVLG